ncbi:protein translocase subunit SecD [Lentisphaerota bacterium WC36G]|nr:protein translocase subunit SecD [Lentisphaerae bacterium WC36]
MNKKNSNKENSQPVLMRMFIALVFIVVFAFSMFPLTERNFYDTFVDIVKKEDVAKAQELVEAAKKIQAENNAKKDAEHMLENQALSIAATEKKVELKELFTNKSLKNNADAIGFIRNKAKPSIRRGLDLSGGVEFTLRLLPPDGAENTDGTPKTELTPQDIDVAIEALRSRLETQGINESEIFSTEGSDLITLRAPLATKQESQKIRQLVQMSARLSFNLVATDAMMAQERIKYFQNPEAYKPPTSYMMMKQPGRARDAMPLLVEIKPKMTGKNITLSRVNSAPGGWEIILRFNVDGARNFGDVTSKNVGRRLAIILDKKLYSAPNLNEPITGGEAQITGDFSQDEAKIVSDALNAGSLQFKVEVKSIESTDPTLGSESVKSGLYAGLAGLAVVVIFMTMYYLSAGLIASVSLIVNMVLILGAMAAFNATLTLPGIAGIVLTIGMAVDANVLIFERIREELQSGKTLKTALHEGFSRAFTTILDANLTTLLTALILMSVGKGAVRGFAVTLSIGIATSMFSTIFLSRLLFDTMLNVTKAKSLKMLNLFSFKNINFLKISRVAGIISIIMIVGSLAVFGIKGKTIFNVDLTGGIRLTMNYDKQVPVEDIDKFLKNSGFPSSRSSYKEQGEIKVLEVVVSDISATGAIANEKGNEDVSMIIANSLNKEYPESKFVGAGQSSISGLVGGLFRKAALTAICLAMLGILIYVTIRFEMAYAFAAIVALFHDVIIAMGVYLLLGYTISLPVIAAILTIIGYSLNDTIVVFDRLREDLGLIKNRSYKSIINESINKTLSRTILTSVTTLMVLIMLIVFGGAAIQDFVFAMLLGVIVGTYSSVFIASPLVALWHKKDQHDSIQDQEAVIVD